MKGYFKSDLSCNMSELFFDKLKFVKEKRNYYLWKGLKGSFHFKLE